MLFRSPLPVRPIPIWFGARSEAAFKRTVRIGDGWHGSQLTPEQAAPIVERLRSTQPDAAFVALHGRDGEDGTVQELLELLGIPYTGSGVSACIRSADKVLAKHAMRDAGIPTPDFYAFNETAFKELGAAGAAFAGAVAMAAEIGRASCRERVLRLV